MSFMTRYVRPEPRLEAGGGKRITESAGYIPPQKQIEQFIIAGRRLAEARKEAYDFQDPEEVDENFYDPTRSPNFDMADASSMLDPAVRRVKQNLKEIKKLKKEQAEKDAAELKAFKESQKKAEESKAEK